MSNIVKEIVFPLDRNYSILQGNTQNKNPIDILYVTIDFNEIKRLVKVSSEHKVSIVKNNNIHVYSNTVCTIIKPKVIYSGSDWAEVYMPETYITVNYDWLLKQVKAIEKGPRYTDYCLLDGDRLIVLSTEVFLEGRSDTSPNALIGGLTKTAQGLLYNGVIPDVWRYFADFIVISEEKPHKVTLSNETKLLIAEMRLQGMEDTAVYRVLQGISNAIDNL